MTGFASNAVFNPAFSLAFILKEHLNHRLTYSFVVEYLIYCVIQFIFAIIGALAAWGVLEHTVHFSVKDGFQDAETFFAELIYTAFIASNTFLIGKLSSNPAVKGGVVCMAVTSGIWTVRKISGACFNPAVAFSINLVSYIKTGKHMGDTWIYLFAPSIGALLGTYISECFGGEVDRIRKIKEVPNEDEEVTITLGD